MNIKEKLGEMKNNVSEKIQKTWEEYKGEIILGGLFGVTVITSVVLGTMQYKQNKEFSAMIKDKYGPNVIHENILGGSVKKRQADLVAWEEGTGKENFDKMLNFAKSLNLGDDEYFSIDRCVSPDNDGLVTEVVQTRGMMMHGDWFKA